MHESMHQLACPLCKDVQRVTSNCIFPERRHFFACAKCGRGILLCESPDDLSVSHAGAPLPLQGENPAVEMPPGSAEKFPSPPAPQRPPNVPAGDTLPPGTESGASLAAFLEPVAPGGVEGDVDSAPFKDDYPSLVMQPVSGSQEELKKFYAPDPRLANVPDVEEHSEPTVSDELEQFLRDELHEQRSAEEFRTVPDTTLKVNEPAGASGKAPQDALESFLENEFRQDLGERRPKSAPLKGGPLETPARPQSGAEKPSVGEFIEVSPQRPEPAERKLKHKPISSGPSPLGRAYPLLLAQVSVDLLTLRPIDLLIDLYLIRLREWCRVWKIMSWLSAPGFIFGIILWLFPSLNASAKALLVSQLLIAGAAAPVFAIWLILPASKHFFRGRLSLGKVLPWFVGAALLQSFAQGLWISKNIQKKAFLFSDLAAPLEPWIAKLDEAAANLPLREKRPAPPVERASGGDNPFATSAARESAPLNSEPAQQEIELTPEAFNLAKELLRPEFPEIAKKDILHSMALVLAEKKGAKALEGDAKAVVGRLKELILREAPQLLKPEVVRQESLAWELPPAGKEGLINETPFYNSWLKLSKAVKFRNWEEVHKHLPTNLRARLTLGDLNLFYLPVTTLGEIFSAKPTVLAATPKYALLRVQYDLAPYIEIDPEKIVLREGIAREIKRNHPVRTAEITYIFVPAQEDKEAPWQAVHFTPKTAAMVRQFYPDLGVQEAGEEIRFGTKVGEMAPSQLIESRIK